MKNERRKNRMSTVDGQLFSNYLATDGFKSSIPAHKKSQNVSLYLMITN